MNFILKNSLFFLVLLCSAKCSLRIPVELDSASQYCVGSENRCKAASLLQISSSRIWQEVSNEALHGGRRNSLTLSIYFQIVLFITVVFCIALALLGALMWSCRRDDVESVDVSEKDPAPASIDTIQEEDGNETEEEIGDWDMSASVRDRFGMQHSSQDERKNYDPEAVQNHIRSTTGNWRLLLHIIGALMQFWSALVYMYWSLLTNKEDLMDCKAEDQSSFVRHLCYYTYACLRGFPILAANMVLVLMIRILMQWRLYYSMLEMKLVVDFADAPIMETFWPGLCGFSILQGAMHLVLKMWFDHNQSLPMWSTYFTITKKFVLPGVIFFAFLWRHADVENTLIPLNRIIEHEYTQDQRYCPWFTNLQVANERVFAFDIRRRNVVRDVQKSIGRAPTLRDIMENLAAHYDEAHELWLSQKHRPWGLLRSLWPGAALVHIDLDWHDKDTRTWLIVFSSLLIGCIITSLCSVVLLFKSGTSVSIRKQFELGKLDTDLILLDVVLVVHALFILLFYCHAIRNMFYRSASGITRMSRRLSPRNVARSISEFSFGGSSSIASRSSSSRQGQGSSPVSKHGSPSESRS